MDFQCYVKFTEEYLGKLFQGYYIGRNLTVLKSKVKWVTSVDCNPNRNCIRVYTDIMEVSVFLKRKVEMHLCPIILVDTKTHYLKFGFL